MTMRPVYDRMLRTTITTAMSGLFLLLATLACSAQGGGSYEVVEAYPNIWLGQPTDIRSPQDGTDRVFVSEKAGKIHVFPNDPDVETTTTFLDLSDIVTTRSEMGLLGVDFDPDFTENGHFYINYNVRRSGTDYTRISRFTVSEGDPNVADRQSEIVILEFRQPFPNHDGGQVVFGPDGYLYIAVGDGGSANDPLHAGQDLRTLLGAILRIDVGGVDDGGYTIPATNPYAGNSEYRQEIWAHGLRNPWRISFDTETGQLWCGDVGQNLYEEIDIIEKGGNYGWRTMEGYHCFNPQNAGDRNFNCDSTSLISPVWEYSHDNGDVSITGGYVYRGQDLPDLVGRYIYADFNSGRIWALDVGEQETTNELLRNSNLNVSTFGTTESQELLIGAFNGKLYRLDPGSGNVDDGRDAGTAFLDAVAPNPATDVTRVRFNVTEAGDVRLRIVNGLGEELLRPIDERRSIGEHVIEIDTDDLPTGSYFVRLETESRQEVRVMRVVR